MPTSKGKTNVSTELTDDAHKALAAAAERRGLLLSQELRVRLLESLRADGFLK